MWNIAWKFISDHKYTRDILSWLSHGCYEMSDYPCALLCTMQSRYFSFNTNGLGCLFCYKIWCLNLTLVLQCGQQTCIMYRNFEECFVLYLAELKPDSPRLVMENILVNNFFFLKLTTFVLIWSNWNTSKQLMRRFRQLSM